MHLEPVIGLETHIEMSTRTKMFCGCDNRGENRPPNTTICPICTGHPGTLPVANRAAVEGAVRMALALGCRPLEHVKFDRKNYFYPDLPKGYQISQYDLPMGRDGTLEISDAIGFPPSRRPRLRNPLAREEEGAGGVGSLRIRINRLHLEEDAAKNSHSPDNQWTFVDYNRAGTPLMEIVTEADFHTAQQAKRYLQELQMIARYLGVSDADMEKGHLRCDANVSLRPVGETKMWPKTEVKNINSFKHVERAIEYEIKRQTKLWETNTPPAEQTTRGWNDAKQMTIEQRWKEGEGDYRYFPEPDLPPLHFGPGHPIDPEKLRASLSELPAAKRARFMEQLGVAPTDVLTLTAEPAIAAFTEAAASELEAWISDLSPSVSGGESSPQATTTACRRAGRDGRGDVESTRPPNPDQEGVESEKRDSRPGKTVGGWITSKMLGILNDRGIAFADAKVTPENFAELLSMFLTRRINATIAARVLEQMVVIGGDPTTLLGEMGGAQVSDTEALTAAVDSAITSNPDPVAQYRSGKTTAIQFLVGQVMKSTKGAADPNVARRMLEERLQ